jgi:hypothetical protein
MRKLLTVLCCSLFIGLGNTSAQELNARVQILSPKLGNANQRNIEVLQKAIRDFLNNNKWTNESYQSQERIDCNLVITLNSWDGNSVYSGEAQIQSSRPVYGTSYTTTLLNINDKDFGFNYTEGQALDYSEQSYVGNLSAMLSFYAYTIIGLDKDSFVKLGGTPYYQKAQQILNFAQSAGGKGWNPADGRRNRYWLNENLLNVGYRPLRNFIFEYHLNGLDKLQINQSSGLKNISSSLNDLKQFDSQKLGAIFPNIYFAAKADELSKVLGLGNTQDKRKAYNLLVELDPANQSKYQSLQQ